ncbi:MAG: class I SAM-dependent methyltransferase [Actinomycetota bacterium]|nr:class I SAM-dependent methyltransferase [Actinomycetota bacterium]
MSAPGAAARGPRDQGTRASRHHTARGPMGLAGRIRLPAARLRARFGRTPERPWIVPQAVGWLGRRMRPDWNVVELGSGRSTVWLGRRAARVIAYEDDESWLARARNMVAAADLENVEIRQLPVTDFAGEVAALEDGSLDLLVIDFLESPEAERVSSVRAGRAKVRPGVYLLLDDSDRPSYAAAYELLAGWPERRFTGVKDEWPEACETAIFRRPG